MAFNSNANTSISNLSDSALNNPLANDVLTYDATSQKWKNGAGVLVSSMKGQANGIAGLDANGKILSAQLPTASDTSSLLGRIEAAEALAVDAPWQLVWSDEFNGSSIDTNKWTHETGGGGWGNDELQTYTDSTDNSTVDGNNLVITARKDGNVVTSARLVSANKFTVRYGRIEARAYCNGQGPGFWPAIWMLGDNIGSVSWPQCGEIDIMEWLSRDPNKVFGTVHGPTYNGGTAYGNNYDFGSSISASWHVFSVEWRPGCINWYVDGNLYFTAKAFDSQIHGQDNWVFDHPFFLIVNMAVGGNFGGSPSGATVYPSNFIIDYIRVYKRKTVSS